MKKIVLIIAASLLFINFSFGQKTHFILESQNMILNNGTEITPIMNVYVSYDFTKKIGLFSYFLITPTWSENIVGITYSPISWAHFSVGAGIENDKHPWRIATITMLTNKRGYFFFNFENGGSGNWYRGILNYKFNDLIGAGLMSEKYVGTGLRMEINLNKKTQIWVSGLYNKDKKINGFLSLLLQF